MSKNSLFLSLFNIFVEDLLQLSTQKGNNYILDWIEKLQSLGKYYFSLAQVKTEFSDVSDHAINLALSRLSEKGKIISIYKGFYLIIPPEYRSRGILPPYLFIDSLMKFINKPYYVGLLSAAALYGAAHQQPQEFFIVTNLKQKPTQKKGLKINYITKKIIPEQLLEERKTESGYMKISSPELTAADVIYYHNKIGGINRAATLLNELAEEIRPKKITPEFVSILSTPTVQRLGYLLEETGQNQLAEKLFVVSQNLNKQFFRQPLKASMNKAGFPVNKKWKIIENTEIEIDE